MNYYPAIMTKLLYYDILAIHLSGGVEQMAFDEHRFNYHKKTNKLLIRDFGWKYEIIIILIVAFASIYLDRLNTEYQYAAQVIDGLEHKVGISLFSKNKSETSHEKLSPRLILAEKRGESAMQMRIAQKLLETTLSDQEIMSCTSLSMEELEIIKFFHKRSKHRVTESKSLKRE